MWPNFPFLSAASNANLKRWSAEVVSERLTDSAEVKEVVSERRKAFDVAH